MVSISKEKKSPARLLARLGICFITLLWKLQYAGPHLNLDSDPLKSYHAGGRNYHDIDSKALIESEETRYGQDYWN